MKLFFTVAALVLLQTGHADELTELRERAETIKDSSSLEIDMVEARRKVHFLLKDLKKWAETYDYELETRSRTFSSPPKHFRELLTADRCPLFFEKEPARYGALRSVGRQGRFLPLSLPQ